MIILEKRFTHHHSPLALLGILALVLGLMVETQLDQITHKVPYSVNNTDFTFQELYCNIYLYNSSSFIFTTSTIVTITFAAECPVSI